MRTLEVSKRELEITGIIPADRRRHFSFIGSSKFRVHGVIFQGR